MIQIYEPSFTFGDASASPNVNNIALEAGVDWTDAEPVLAASWQMVEAFTGKVYRDTTAGQVVLKTIGAHVWTWPRYPFPAAVSFEVYSQGGWVAHNETYIPSAGLIELETHTLYRISQVGTVAAAPVTAAVEHAVRNLTLYQLIQSPARREFKSHTAGDSSLVRESLMPVFKGSGAGALLAGEVRF